MTTIFINLNIELNKHQKEYDDWIKNNSLSLVELRLERQSLQWFWKNEMKIKTLLLREKGKERKDCTHQNTVIGKKMLILS